MSNKALRTALLKGVNEYATYAQAFSEASYAFIREATFLLQELALRRGANPFSICMIRIRARLIIYAAFIMQRLKLEICLRIRRNDEALS